MTQWTKEQLEEVLALLEELAKVSAENLRLKRKDLEEKVRTLAHQAHTYEQWAAIIKQELQARGGTPKPKEVKEPAEAAV